MPVDLETFASEIISNVEKVIVGKREKIELMLAAMLSQGHILLEDVPGTGKTMLAHSMAISMGIEFKRLQCTPDLLPTDITGVPVFLPHEGRFQFQPGPVFTHILLADEINRATPRTQSALLEAMQERQVTVGNTTHPLSRPFMVMATQNPIEYEGTFPLPEAQLDRFIMRISMGYPDFEDERTIIRDQRNVHPIESLKPVADGRSLIDLGRQVADIHVDTSLEDYALKLVKATREHSDLLLGASSRGALALYKTSQAWAALKGRDYVVPDDMKKLAPFVLTHRLLLQPESQLRGNTPKSVVDEIVSQTEIELAEVA
ncbi:MAG: MoxR family ATPase [Deltaproteobacteria bacterium]|nr:MoxR family ATPase [Deltaproteobacteria bacterium]